MSPETLRETLTGLLAREREALRALDAAAVLAAASEKATLLDAVNAADPVSRRALVAVLAELRDDLRRNLVLLAHARDCLRALCDACAPHVAATNRVSREL